MATYVMSDIHGLQGRFTAMLDHIHLQNDDTLFVLGDVIDRGPDGIALLKQILHHPQMILLMGNHEYMMLEYYEALGKLRAGRDLFHSMECIHRWDHNHNKETKSDFAAMPRGEQRALLDHLRELPLAYCDVKVKDRRFYLVHANWEPRLSKEILYLKDFVQNGMNPASLLWDRITEGDPLPPQRTLIFGHTITYFYHPSHPYQIWSGDCELSKSKMIAIDCGCAANREDSRLACIRLDDMEVFYV